ncbi:hypothetical protein JX266_003790 [Neoarthrinium moseri]|uniref:uncharacterized protein n=1 Tax=Neoarthrinium moseri TaxID=1658444 RepID=UPI001FDC7C52|nr:uncharacterized protein JN550_011406 [Neoarthrinium moseri]KAI1851125.1 hypothetical protein JX266_003790 [Neoarthrinium moseri]KAI1860681.1 hypothetical protein JN550_011406 [Neoarthrinium moseri]
MPVVIPTSDQLQRGQALYKAGNLIEASQCFKSIIKNCSGCKAGKPSVLCECNDLLAACQNRTLADVLRKPCRCPQRAHMRCKEDGHVSALANLVMVAVKAKDYKRGLVYAQNLVYLAPRDPRGYLRLGQVLRLVDRHRTALGVYQQGIVLVAKAKPDHPGLKTLQDQAEIVRKLVSQVDPIETLPAELINLVFSHLSTRELCRFLRVSKSWKAFLESSAAKPLWLSQHYDVKSRFFKKPKPQTTQKYLVTYPGGQLKHLVLDQLDTVSHGDKVFIMLSALPRLETFILHGSATLTGNLPPIGKLPKLKVLSLAASIRIECAHLNRLIAASANTLEELAVMGCPYGHGESQRVDWPQLPNLRTLKLVSPGIGTPFVDMETVMCRTPNVENVLLDAIQFGRNRANDERPDGPLWPHLRRVALGPGFHVTRDMRFPALSEAVTELVLENDSILHVCTSLESAPEDMELTMIFSRPSNIISVGIPHLPRLETLVLRGRYPLTPEAFQLLAQPSVASDSLRHLYLSPFPWQALNVPGGLEWARPSEDQTGLEVLNANYLIGEVGRHIEDPDEALVRLCDHFPNLKDLDIGAETVSPITLGRLLEKTKITNLYHYQGALMTELRDWAKTISKNVTQGKNPKNLGSLEPDWPT